MRSGILYLKTQYFSISGFTHQSSLFAYLKLNIFPITSQKEVFCSVKNATGNLIGIALNLQIASGDVVTTLISSNRRTQTIPPSVYVIFDLSSVSYSLLYRALLSPSVQFSSVAQSCLTLCEPMNQFIPRYFTLSVAMVNGTASLISLSDFS